MGFFRATARRMLFRLQLALRRFFFSGSKCYCCLCKSRLRSFKTYSGRPNAQCPTCGSLERHRMDWLFMLEHTGLLDGTPKRLLHVAPELALEIKFREINNINYLSGDLNNPNAMIRIDVTDIGFPEDHFDIIYCSHVLEHVTEDRKAMKELFRVLKPKGWAMLQVPITARETFEDPTATTPEDRERLYGHREHVRRYGLDYKDRLTEAGFAVQVFSSNELTGDRDPLEWGFDKHHFVFFCVKEGNRQAVPNLQ